MLSDIIKQASGWDTKALAKIFSNKKFLRSFDGDKEKYLADLIPGYAVTLPREIIPDSVTLDALCFTHKKDPLTLPILLRYFTHKNLLQEAKDDFDKLNQKLQDAMDKDLKDLQDKQKKLQEDRTNLNNVEMHSEKAKALAIDKIDEQITKASSEIEKIKSYKKDIETLFKGGKVELSSYPQKYSFILERELTKVMEEKLAHYVKDDTNIEKTYSSLNSKRKKIIMLKDLQRVASILSLVTLVVTAVICIIGRTDNTFRRAGFVKSPTFSTYEVYVVIGVSVAAILLAIAGAAYLIERHYEQSFAKEMQDFIEGPKYVDKATNTEDVKESEQKETKVGNLIDFSSNDEAGVKPSAPPWNELEQSGLYPDLSEAQPPSYEEACNPTLQPKDSKLSSNFNSALPLSNTAGGVILS